MEELCDEFVILFRFYLCECLEEKAQNVSNFVAKEKLKAMNSTTNLELARVRKQFSLTVFTIFATLFLSMAGKQIQMFSSNFQQ